MSWGFCDTFRSLRESGGGRWQIQNMQYSEVQAKVSIINMIQPDNTAKGDCQEKEGILVCK